MNTVKQQLLDKLNIALQSNKAAIKRSGMSCSVSKLNMQETEAQLLNAIKLVEVCCDCK